MRFHGYALIGAGVIFFLAANRHAKAQSLPAGTPDLTSYILTSAAKPAPRLTGPKVYGQRPGHPFLFTLTATGDRPMSFAAQGLPEGLSLDAATGQITGNAAKAGMSQVRVTAKNAAGTATRDIKIVIGDQIALTPPMGWNSWNSWAGNVSQDKVLQSARVMVDTGLINHGWTYINIDDTWQGKRTGPDHALMANGKFPDLKGLCDQLHHMGLKAGIYSTPWITSYASYPGGSSDSPDGAWDKAIHGNTAFQHVGAYHFAVADAKQYAAWGFDYLKYDWNIDPANMKEMSDALRNSGRDIVYSLSNTAPLNQAAVWAKSSNAWRTTGDIVDLWGRAPSGWQHGMAEIGFTQDRWARFSGPGHWNDPDMLVVGTVSLAQAMHRTRLTPDEQYTHISLWCLLNAPLLIGCDMQRLDPFTCSLLSNDEVLDINQDSLGKQAVRVAGPAFVPPAPAGGRGRRRGTTPATDASASAPASNPGRNGLVYSDRSRQAAPFPPASNPGGNGLVYARPLEDGSLAMGLFNVGPAEEKVVATWKDAGLEGKQTVRDLWRQKDLGVFDTEFSATVPPHGVVLLKLSKAP